MRLIKFSCTAITNRAYEAGTTQTARRFDGGTVQRRPQNTGRRAINRDTLALISGTDDADVTSVSKTVGEEGPVQTKEWKEMRDLARSVFHVYFTNNDCDDDENSQLKQSDASKKSSLLKKINGTMPWLPELINGSDAPNVVKAPVLFLEASLRGMAQVRMHTSESGMHETQYLSLDIYHQSIPSIQVFFQNNPLSGLLILIAMFVQSSRVAVHGIIAIICGNLAGLFMGFDENFLSCGLFGYNSFLVGLAIATFDSGEMHMGYNLAAVVGVVITSYFSSVLLVMLGKILAPYKVSWAFHLGVYGYYMHTHV